MIGLFPREERNRLIANVLMITGAVGLAVGWIRASAVDRSELAGTELVRSSPRELFGSYWAIGAFVAAIMIVGVRSIGPWLLLGACIVIAIVAFQISSRCPKAFRAASLSAAGLLGALGFQMLSGSGGLAWLFLTLAMVPVLFDLVSRYSDSLPGTVGWVGTALGAAATIWILSRDGLGLFSLGLIIATVSAAIASRTNNGTGLRLGALVIAGLVMWRVAKLIGIENLDWDEWGGFYMNLLAASVAIVLAFPFGLLLALARRSKLPAVRWMATAYIELIRGVPLISLLLMARFFLGFFLDSDTPLSLPTRAFAAITLFSAAYIAEIVRGGLQAVPSGQVEAGQALGLPAAGITRLLVLPQALRAVIPAMVGQFISLFKDTSLLVIISVLEFVGVRDIVHAQEAFRSIGFAETLVFIAFGFWAFSFTMSRESQRLERRLSVSN